MWMDDHFNLNGSIWMIDQTALPDSFEILESGHYQQTYTAIKEMVIRGAGAIGVAGAFAMAQAVRFTKAFYSPDKYQKNLEARAYFLKTARPTAYNLFHAIDRVYPLKLRAPSANMSNLFFRK